MPKVKMSEKLVIAGAFLGLIGGVGFVGNAVFWLFGDVTLMPMFAWVAMLVTAGAMMNPQEK